MATRTLVEGIDVVALRAIPALRIRVSMSLIGSLTVIRAPPSALPGWIDLPARLGHARELAVRGQLAETNSADAEFRI